MLKMEDPVLAYELAEATVLRVSPDGEPWSSAWCDPLRNVPSVAGPRAAFGMSPKAPFRVGCEPREVPIKSCVLALALSRSLALSLATRGAAGKNCAKLALVLRVIVGDLLPLPPRPSANHPNARGNSAQRHHAFKLMWRYES